MPSGSSAASWFTLTPTPQTTPPRDDSRRIPATFASPTSTSFGHLSSLCTPATRSIASATASPVTSESCSAGAPGAGRSSREARSDRPATSSHARPLRPRPPVWCSVTATAPSGSSASRSDVLGRGALRAPAVRRAEPPPQQRPHDVGRQLVVRLRHRRCQSSSVAARPRFTLARRRFASSRRSREARGRRGRNAAALHPERLGELRRRAARPRGRGCATGCARPARWRARPGRPGSSTRRFCASVSDADAATSKSASTRVSVLFACCPPGPDDRETRSSISSGSSETERVTRIDSAAMACILLDVDGVLHVSGEAIPGAPAAVARLRDPGHTLRFVTNNSTQAARAARGRAAEPRIRARRRGAADDGAHGRPRARRQARARPRHGRGRARPRGDRAGRGGRGRGPHRRLRRDGRAEPGLQLHEPRPGLRGDPAGRRPLLPPQEQLVADEPRAAARRRRVRRRAGVRDRRRGGRARQAEPGVLRGGARRARRRARADVARRRRRRGRPARREDVRHEDRARPHRQVPPRHARAARSHARRRRQLDRATCPTGSSARSSLSAWPSASAPT